MAVNKHLQCPLPVRVSRCLALSRSNFESVKNHVVCKMTPRMVLLSARFVQFCRCVSCACAPAIPAAFTASFSTVTKIQHTAFHKLMLLTSSSEWFHLKKEARRNVVRGFEYFYDGGKTCCKCCWYHLSTAIVKSLCVTVTRVLFLHTLQ